MMRHIEYRERPTDDAGWRPENSGMTENPGVFDTGNGALKFRYRHPEYPGVVRVEFRSYCGREADADWYECDHIPGYHYADPAEASADERPAASLAAAQQSERRQMEIATHYARIDAIRQGEAEQANAILAAACNALGVTDTTSGRLSWVSAGGIVVEVTFDEQGLDGRRVRARGHQAELLRKRDGKRLGAAAV